jgi:hypothetical protein
MESMGSKLRAIRNAWKLTLRQVDERSLALSQQWGNPAYRISASWLDRVERENRELSAAKLIVLASIYSLTPEQMLGLSPPPEPTSHKIEETAAPNGTILASGRLDGHAKYWLPENLVTDAPPETTKLLEPEPGVLPDHFRRGIIGRQDRTLEPMIPAGSIVLIDTRKKAIANRKDWSNEFDRPIYFLMARDEYVCGFCELERETDWLTVIPHMLSYQSNRRWKYKKDIEVVGSVVALMIRRAG